ncbi:MAG: FGGY-family carbohydrate kinase, partial [Lachnospiraceae bacterium]|nr:FGGY-family carbohydrate kinase [Lachnospiraceae bacterium]
KISGQRVLGIGDASGMFPVDSATNDYRTDLIQKYEKLTGIDLRKILPKVLTAGENAGRLTAEGAQFLDPEGDLKAGIPLAPPEGDAGTGMTATNSVKVHTGNVSAGTSDFAMIVVEKEVGVHRELDMVTTPAGDPVAMVHCNNCTSDLNAWVQLFQEVTELAGMKISKSELFTTLFRKALEGEKDCGGLMNINYISGEGVTDLDDGRPLFLRRPDASFDLANFMKAQLYSAISTLKIGLDILTQTEGVQIQSLCGHGGFFKTKGVGDLLLSAASGVPVKTMETAGEGGPYGMALLGAYLIRKEEGETLSDYLDNKVFANIKTTEIMAAEEDISGFAAFLEDYKKALAVEKTAVKYW